MSCYNTIQAILNKLSENFQNNGYHRQSKSDLKRQRQAENFSKKNIP